MDGLTLQSCTTQLWLWKLRVLTQDILVARTGAGWALMHLLGTHTWANWVLMPEVTGCSHGHQLGAPASTAGTLLCKPGTPA